MNIFVILMYFIVGLISETELGAQSVVYELATIAYMVGVPMLA